MESTYQQIRREQLREAIRSNPDAVVDLILNLEKRIKELEARLRMNSPTVQNRLTAQSFQYRVHALPNRPKARL